MDNLKDKKILLCVTGSIAAFKACEFIRLLRKQGCNVKVVIVIQHKISLANLARCA